MKMKKEKFHNILQKKKKIYKNRLHFHGKFEKKTQDENCTCFLLNFHINICSFDTRLKNETFNFLPLNYSFPVFSLYNSFSYMKN